MSFSSYNFLNEKSNQRVKIIPFYRREFCWLNALQVEKAWCAFVHTIKRGNKILLKEELESNIFALVIKKSRRQPLRIKYSLSATSPSSKRIVFEGIDKLLNLTCNSAISLKLMPFTL